MIKYICNNCGVEYPKWMGKCTACSKWNSLEEVEYQKNQLNKIVGNKKLDYKDLYTFSASIEPRITTSISEFDRVLGGGLVKGEVILVSGDPGIGKSTLILNTISKIAISGHKILYATGEESINQISLRSNRIIKDRESLKNIIIVADTDIDSIINLAKSLKIDVLIIDSIQTVQTSNVVGVSGGIAQVKECANILSRFSKSTDIISIMIGHVNKEGVIAGPKVLEHLVDAVLYLEGDNFQGYRILRSIKNRYGAQGEIGVFEMNDSGMIEVQNPSDFFINSLTQNSYGVCLGSIMEGIRPLILEIQSLTLACYPGNARRISNGIDQNRLQLIIAVISKILGYKLQNFDVYLNIVGGLKVKDPSLDLSICVAIISSYLNKTIGQEKVYIGEIGLSGEIRPTLNIDKRLKEVHKLGIKTVIISKTSKYSKAPKSLKIIEISNIKDILSTF